MNNLEKIDLIDKRIFGIEFHVDLLNKSIEGGAECYKDISLEQTRDDYLSILDALKSLKEQLTAAK